MNLGKVFLLWIWTTFFIPFIVWPHDKDTVASTITVEEATENFKKSQVLLEKPYLPAKTYESGEQQNALTIAYLHTEPSKIKPSAAENSESKAITIEEAEVFSNNSVSLCIDLIQYGKKLEKEIGHETFKERLDDGLIKLTEAELGKAELNSVDEIKFPRIVVNGSESSVVFLNEDLVHPDSRHLHRVIAGQHINGGRSRNDGEIGRNVIVAWYKNGNDQGFSRITKAEFFPRHKRFSTEWWRDFALYLDNPFKRKNWMDHVLFMGLTFGGLLQADITAGVRLLEMGMKDSVNSGAEKVLFTAIFGATFGVFSTQLRRAVTLPQTDLGSALVHAAVTSIPFGIFFKILDPEQGLAAFDFSRSVGWKTALDLCSIVIITNAARVGPYKCVALLNKERKNTGKFMGTPKADWQTQMASIFILMPPRLLDLGTSFGFTLSIGAMALGVSGGKLVLIALWPTGKYVYTRLAEALNAEEANKIRADWEKSMFGFFLGLPIGTGVDTLLLPFQYENRLAKMKDRLNRQKHAPLYHSGRVVRFLSELFKMSAPKSDDEIIPTTRRARCALKLASLADKMQAPFNRELVKIAARGQKSGPATDASTQ